MKPPDFLQQVVNLATAKDWLVHQTESNSGFPNLILARRQRVMIIQVKSGNGRLTKKQREWFDVLTGDTNSTNPYWDDGSALSVEVWRPSQQALIEKLLT